MRCTDCSRPLSPIVAIDIDGVLGDYHGHLRDFAEQYLGRSLRGVPKYSGLEPHSQWYARMGVDLATFRDIKLAYRQGGMKRSMPCNESMTILTWKLHRMGVEVWITTTRPYLRLDNVDPDTRAFMERNQIYFDHLMYDEHKYPRLGEMVDKDRVVAIIDDEPEMYDEAVETFGTAIPFLYMSGYNDAVVRPQMLLGPVDAREVVVRQVKRWKAIADV